MNSKNLIKKSAQKASEELIKNLSLISYSEISEKKVENIKKVILKFLSKELEVSEAIKEIIKNKLPFFLIQKFIENFKVELAKEIAVENPDSKEETKTIKAKLQNLENEIAKEYLKINIGELEDIKNSKLKKYALYRAHANYIERIIESVRREELSKFPLESYTESDFKTSIYYPESIMACMNAYLCDYLENLEKAVFRAAKAFFILLKKGNYTEGLLAFGELKELALKVSQKLAELYFQAFTKGDSNFIKLVEYLKEFYPKQFIAALDFADLKKLNRTLSEAKVDKILEETEKVIQNFFESQKKNYLAVRGINHNFLILGVGIEEEKFEKDIKKLTVLLEKTLKQIGTEAPFRVYGFLLDERFEGFENRLNNLLTKLKEISKKEEKQVFIITNEEGIEKLFKWQKEQLRKISFITGKINNNNIEIVFQPIADSKTFNIIALETLFRLRDGDSLVPPGLFIDLIYQFNLITNIDKIVLKRILEQKDLVASVTTNLFINVSPQSLSSVSFLKKLDNFLKKMENFSIFLEITEQRLLENACELKQISKKYPNLKFAIDDFGSGYSSFKLVIDLAENRTLEVLKLDGSFTKKISSSQFTRNVVKAIGSLSKNLGIKTVAEFVEEPEAAEILKKEGIDFLQGYFISKPKTIEEIIYQAEKVSNF
ncbi:EAL domain-containing protein (putative c-di-GMP-specific phosphodiesterase class I) [Thermovibrio guaymasensis]|uniref:EAL domain-containing protein (Putative c-di-GMP-specific phosphodiesterase class I) n=1 Tax=Thermovibrio guaymasensis TaxID=240167 RepID=A0A420W6K2_9BACT|nr:EAL domain-containing protein [Thermovibrio guaymasensis]RKQ61674.1 EAL domain-containing protein (putative c-di-GMP-specific phosphodiesterase class I) [Thermovibrio guaymasensis]